jgi:hypothetical protein
MVDRHQTRLFYAGFLFSSEIQNPAWNFLDLWMEYITNQGLALLLMKSKLLGATFFNVLALPIHD